jgi:hypothetical protein
MDLEIQRQGQVVPAVAAQVGLMLLELLELQTQAVAVAGVE